jgi:hypothetical protein
MSDPVHHDLLGITLRMNDRVVCCRCTAGGHEELLVQPDRMLDAGDSTEAGLTVSYVMTVNPLIVWLADANRYVRIPESRQLVIVDESATEQEARRALRGVGQRLSRGQESP